MDGKLVAMMPRSIIVSYDRKKSLIIALTYTIARQVTTLPSGAWPRRRAKKAPSMVICDLFAARKFVETGDRSSREKPACMYAERDQRFDCAPVSVIAQISACATGLDVGVPD